MISELTPVSAGADLIGRGLALRFDGAGTINVPGLALPAADFVREGQAIPVVEAPASEAVLERRKIKVITTATSELLRSSNAEALIRQVLVDATGPALDRVMFGAGAADEERPAGLLHGIAALSPTASLTDDLATLIGAVAPVAGNGGVVLIASATQAVAINLLPRVPYLVVASASLPAGVVIAVAINAMVSATDGPPAIETSRSATLHEVDTSPAVDIGGGVIARPVRNLFQSDTVGLKLRWPLSWALRDPRGIAWMQR